MIEHHQTLLLFEWFKIALIVAHHEANMLLLLLFLLAFSNPLYSELVFHVKCSRPKRGFRRELGMFLRKKIEKIALSWRAGVWGSCLAKS